MKKLIIFLLLLIIIISGCTKNKPVDDSRFGQYAIIITDSITGCRYVQFSRGVSALYDKNSKVEGCGLK